MTADPSPTSSPPNLPRWTRAGEVLLVAMVFFILAGAPAPHVNETHYLARLKHFWNPAWGAGDVFLESGEAHLGFAWAFGPLSMLLPLPALAWVGRVLAWLLLAWAWQRLSWRIVPAPLAAVLSATLWAMLTERANLAGEWVVGGVEAKCFAYVLVFVGLRELADQNWNRLWLAFGAASALHVLVGGWSAVLCGGIWVADRIQARRSSPGSAVPSTAQSFRAMLPGLIGGGLLASIGVLPALALTWSEPPDIISQANQIYVFHRLPHHLALLTLPDDEVVRHFSRHGLLIAALFVLRRVRRRIALPPDDALRLVTWFAWGAVLLAGIGVAIEFGLRNDPARAAALLRYYWYRMTDVAVPLAVALQATSILVAGLAARHNWAAWALVATLVVAGTHLVTAVRNHTANPVPPADRRMLDYAAWVDACEWVAAHTPPDALFITPRRSQSFKWRTGRPEVATWKDLPQDAQSMVEWFRRLRTIYYDEIDGQLVPAWSLGHSGTERVLAAAREFGADYVICDNRAPLELPMVYPTAEYPNDTYVIYRVPQ